MNSRATWKGKQQRNEQPKFKIQNNQNQLGRGIWLFKNDMQSPLMSQDFGQNPLLSNSKLWKHSPIIQEELKSPSSNKNNFDESICGIQSPDINDISIADENISVSPLPLTNALQTFTFKAQLPYQSQKKRIEKPTNFHDNYLRLGLWPELSFEKQKMIRDSYRQMKNVNYTTFNNDFNQSRNNLMNQNESLGFLYTSMNHAPLNLSVINNSQGLRNRANSLMISQENPANAYFYAKQQQQQGRRPLNILPSQTENTSQTRCARCTSVDNHSNHSQADEKENPQQYKDGLKKALDLINVLIDKISEHQSPEKQRQTKRESLQINEDIIDLQNKENIYPQQTLNRAGKAPKSLLSSGSLNMSSQKELKTLIQVIKKAKANNDSLRESRNYLETINPPNVQDSINFQNISLVAPSENLMMKPPKSSRSNANLLQARKSNNMMKEVLNRLHKLNKCKQGLSNEQKDDINQSVLALCDLIL